MGGDILGGLGDRYPCQHVPTILVAGLVSHGQLNPSNMVALLSRERKREETPGVGMWPRQPKKSSACGVLTPAGTRRNKRRVVWDVGAGVDGWHGCLPMPPWLPPTGSARLVSSRRHRPLPTFPLPFPADSRFQQTQRPRKTQSLRDQSRILPIGCPWRSPSSLVVGFIGLLVTLLPPNPFFFLSFLILLRPSPPGYPRPCTGDKVTRLSVLHANAELTRDLGPFGGDLSLSAGNNTTIPP